jgi:hypothetical protein
VLFALGVGSLVYFAASTIPPKMESDMSSENKRPAPGGYEKHGYSPPPPPPAPAQQAPANQPQSPAPAAPQPAPSAVAEPSPPQSSEPAAQQGAAADEPQHPPIGP